MHGLAPQGMAGPGDANHGRGGTAHMVWLLCFGLPLRGLPWYCGCGLHGQETPHSIARSNEARHRRGNTTSTAWFPRACLVLGNSVIEEEGTDSPDCLLRACPAPGGKPSKR